MAVLVGSYPYHVDSTQVTPSLSAHLGPTHQVLPREEEHTINSGICNAIAHSGMCGANTPYVPSNCCDTVPKRLMLLHTSMHACICTAPFPLQILISLFCGRADVGDSYCSSLRVYTWTLPGRSCILCTLLRDVIIGITKTLPSTKAVLCAVAGKGKNLAQAVMHRGGLCLSEGVSKTPPHQLCCCFSKTIFT